MANSSPSSPSGSVRPKAMTSSPTLSSPSLVTNNDPLQSHQPPLRARLHALLHPTDSHSGSSPAVTPSSESASQHHISQDPQSSTTSLESLDRDSALSKPLVSPSVKRKPPRGALSVLPKTRMTPSSPSTAPIISPPPKLAALPRSVTTSNLEQSAASQRSDSRSSGPTRASSLDPSHLTADPIAHTVAATEDEHHQPASKQPRQRPSIKVRIITWNMHDSVPKGDLEVLLGKAGQYVAPDSDWDISYDSDNETADLDEKSKARRGAHVVGQEHVPRADRIPPLPHDDSHPYHILVIAGQECPWGDGKRLATSVGMAGELGDFGKQKNRSAKDKDKEHQKDKAKPLKPKEKQRSGDSDEAADGSRTAHSTIDEPISSIQGLSLPSDDHGFPFMSTSVSSALPGHPLASPMIGGTSMPGFSGSSEAGTDDKLAVWPNIGGHGWSDLCEDWLCRNQAAKKDKPFKDKSFISGARLARALSQSTNHKREPAPSRDNPADPQHTMPTHSLSAAVTPELSRAASPVGVPFSASAPGTPNQSTFEGFNAFIDPPPQSPLDAPVAGAGAEKRKRLVPKLNLNPVDLVKKSSPSVRSSPAHLTDTDCVSSPVLLSPTAEVPKGGQHLPAAQHNPAQALAGEPSTVPHSTSLQSFLAVPGSPAMSRMSSSHSLSKLAAASTDPVSRSTSPSGTDVHVEPPTPSRSPSPCPNANTAVINDGQIPPRTVSSAPSAVTGTAIEGGVNQNPEKSLADAVPKALGPYELVIKERMMGCYMAVYVWRGCKDRVRGASRSHVKSGLLAGRVGNKGGVGISLKLGTTRLLFVNAHLAAHEDKVALRLANVAKIKAALKVDSFLPATDPRSKLDDITEQFDHTFWFGDLNFRIDISRQHADWLMMNKKYDQALAFDQLGKVLKEGDAFKGFKEAPIHFPPTYKYDVLKTLKIKRNKTLASIKSGIDIPGAAAGGTPKIVHSELSTPPLGERAIPEESAIGFDSVEEPEDQQADVSLSYAARGDSDPETASRAECFHVTPASAAVEGRVEAMEVPGGDRSDEDQYSVASSSAFGSMASSSGFAQSFQAHEARLQQGVDRALAREREVEQQRQRQLAENTSAAQGPRFFSQGAAIKAKFKIMDMVRSATTSNLKDKLGGAGLSDGQQSAGGHGKKKWFGAFMEPPRRGGVPASASSDNNSIVDSIGSMPSPAMEQSFSVADPDESFVGGGARRGSLLSAEAYLSSAGHDDGNASTTDQESVSSAYVPPTKGPPRRSSLQMAKASAKAIAKAQRDAKYPHLTGATAEQIDFLEAQPYDTSAKQRVPSWCDRVLFRSTVPLDPEDADESDQLHKGGSRVGVHEAGLGSRVGSALSHALITPIRHAAERRHHHGHAQRSTSSGLIAAVAGSSSIAFAHDQPTPPEASVVERLSRRPSAVRRKRVSTTATANLTASAPSSPKAETRMLAAVDGTRHPHLLQRFLHPARRRHQMKALSPSLTLSDLSHAPVHDTSSWAMKNGSVDMLLPTSSSLGLGIGSGLGLAGLESKAISTVDLPSQVEERDNRFDGAAKKAVSPVLLSNENKPRVVIPPRQSSSAASSPVIARGVPSVSPTAGVGPASPASPPGKATREGVLGVKPPVRSGSVAVCSSSSEPSIPAPAPPMPSRSVPPIPHAPRRSHSGSASAGGWMDSISSHLPAFFAPAISALRSHRQSTSQGMHNEDLNPDSSAVEKGEEEEVVVGPKKGRIECLLYKSLDDREMRVLEGRSDHRPVIFVGAIGI